MTRSARVAAAAATIGAAVSAVLAAQAKSDLRDCEQVCWIAHEVTLQADRYEARVDNKYPANGSWIWVRGKGARADYYQEGDGRMRQIYSPKNGANSKELASKVVRFRVCGPNGIGGDTCSVWWAPNSQRRS